MNALASLIIALNTSASAAVPVSLSAPGEVFLTPAEVQAVRQRVARDAAWAKVAREIIAEAGALAAEPLDIPRTGGQWSHWYSCPEDGGRLRAESPTEHRCTVCGEAYSGWPYDEVHVTFRHSHWLRGAETLGWAYTLEPNPAHARRVRDILLAYADFYEALPLHDKRRGKARHGARLYAQTLDEAVTLCHMMIGYDRVYQAECFTQEDHDAIAEQLIRPMTATIMRNDSGASNWQTWHNAAIACAGFVLQDKELVDSATNGRHGLLYQLDGASVMESGMWYEGAPSYHWYALTAMVYQLEASARAGMDLYGKEPVRKLFDAPMRLLFPDLTFPAINDSTRGSIRGARQFYEIAWKRYGDPRYTTFLEPRESPWALFWGSEPIPGNAPTSLALTSSNDESDGIAILRDQANETALFFEYGPAMSGHVHPAKLGIILYAHGDERFVDPGRLPYGNPLHGGWYTQTIAHNTITMDGKSQRRNRGALVQYECTKDYALVRAVASGAYPDVSLDRTLILTRGLVLDVFHAESDKEHVFDLALHVRGKLEAPCGEPLGAPLGEGAGYEHLKDVRPLQGMPTFLTGPDHSIQIRFHSGAERYAAMGYGSNPTESLPCVIQRTKGASARLVQVYVITPGEAPEYECGAAGEKVRFAAEGGPIFEIPRQGKVTVTSAANK